MEDLNEYVFLNSIVMLNGYNDSNITYQFPLPGKYTTFDQILYQFVVPILFGIITIIGIFGNALVIRVITGKYKMRTATNLLLLNLAIADLTFVVICPPFTAYQFATQNWPFGNITCKLMHYLVNVSAYVTIYTLVLIALVRYLTIVHNQRTLRMRSTANIILLMICIWIIMLVANMPIIFSYSAHKVFEHIPDSDIECSIISIEVAKQSFATFFIFSYVVPLCIIIVFSVFILHFICQQQTSTLSAELRTRGNSRNMQASRMLVIVIVLFAVLWLPVHINLLMIFFAKFEPSTNFHKAISALCHTLAYFNSCVNPIVYNYVSKDFRDRFKDVMMCNRNADAQQTHTVLETNTLRHSYRKNSQKREMSKCRQDESETFPFANGHTVTDAAEVRNENGNAMEQYEVILMSKTQDASPVDDV